MESITPNKKRRSSISSHSSLKKRTNGTQFRNSNKDTDEDEGPGEFEDPWEDEYESDNISSDEEVIGEEDEEMERTGNGLEEMDLDEAVEEEEEEETVPYLMNGKDLKEDEELIPDLSSYIILHQARLKWPCLSFDILKDVRSVVSLNSVHVILIFSPTHRMKVITD